MPGEELSPIALIRLEKFTLLCSFSGRLLKNLCITALHCSTCTGLIANETGQNTSLFFSYPNETGQNTSLFFSYP
jgi:hypothetical protein